MTITGDTEAGAAAVEPAKRRMRRSAELLLYAGLVLLALAPGLIALRWSDAGPVAPWLSPLAQEMKRIAFGHGWRFWMGVAGATAMAMLLLYPLRKLIGLGRILSVATWFRLHIVLGLAGPVLVLYHCNFGLGSTPANVALFTALAVAASGLVGHFAHQRSNAKFYDEAAETRLATDRVRTEVGRWKDESARTVFLAELSKLNRPVAGGRRTLVTGLLTLRRLRRRRRNLLQFAFAVISRETPAGAQRKARMIRFRDALGAYAFLLRRSARASVGERMLVGWRMLHLPLFAVTVAAGAIHVVKVWDIDTPAETSIMVEAKPTLPDTPPPVSLPPKPALVRETLSAETRTQVAARPDTRPATSPVVPPSRTAQPAPQPARSEAAPQRPASVDTGRLPAPPAPVPAAKPEPIAADPPPPRLAKAPEPETPPSRLGMPLEQPAPKMTSPATATPVPVKTQTKDDPIERLRKLLEADTRGQFEPTALAMRLGDLKNANFDHSKTRFPLTGRHATAKCESCHKTTLKDTPRDCIACHKQDDIHRGRRPDCARCHVTSDWSTIKRKK